MQKIIVVYREPLALGLEQLLAHLAALPQQPCVGVTAHVKTAVLPSGLLADGSFDLSIACGLSLWVRSSEDLGLLRAPLQAIGAPESIYSVVESTPREYAAIDWHDGERSPGVTLFALLKRRAGLGEAEFQRLWQEHTGMSLRFHPLTRYHRNTVLRKLEGDGEAWDGIVEERVGAIEDLAPDRFYIGEGARERAVAHLASFVDIFNGGMRCALLEEYIVRRPCWLGQAAC